MPTLVLVTFVCGHQQFCPTGIVMANSEIFDEADVERVPMLVAAIPLLGGASGNGKTATTGFTTSTCGTQQAAVMKRQLPHQATSTEISNPYSTISHCLAPNIENAIKPTLTNRLDCILMIRNRM